MPILWNSIILSLPNLPADKLKLQNRLESINLISALFATEPA